MERITGNAHTTAGGGEADSRIHMHAGSGGEARGDSGESAGRFDAMRQRAEGLSQALGRGATQLSLIRDKPLASVGLAFAAGFFIAAATATGNRHWALDRLRRNLRAALIGGLAAALADELKDLFEGDERLGQLLHGFIPGDEGDEEDDDL